MAQPPALRTVESMEEPVNTSSSGRPQVRVVGGGVAGLEAAMALADLAGDRAELSLIAPDPDFFYKPLVVEEPFTHQPAERHELEPLVASLGGTTIHGALARVDPEAKELHLAGGERLGYDYALICVGGRATPAYAQGETFWANRSDFDPDALLAAAAESKSGVLALVAPPGTTWPLPLYELALMLRRRAEESGRDRVGLRLLTPEDGPLAIFGVPASGSVAELLRARRIEFEGGVSVEEADDGLLYTRPGGMPVEAGALVALPRITGPRIEGLPADRQGFIRIDERCRVAGAEDLYAAGDATTFPVKQGGIATQQADCAAEQIAAQLGAAVDPKPFHPILRGQLLTGMESLNMRHALGGGEGEGEASLDYLWWPPQKVSGRYLSAWLSHVSPQAVPELPFRPLDVEVSWPSEWHAEPLIGDAEPG
jgi:sulfide:quinone oxidoreductase